MTVAMKKRMVIEQESRVELNKANDVIGQFITSCSHSMRGPLKSIEGLVNLLQSTSDFTGPEREKFLDLITSTARKMERMLDELEHFLENSRRDVSISSINVKSLINEVLRSHQRDIENQQVTVEVLGDQYHVFLSDANRLRLVLTNLIRNAIGFSDPGKEQKMVTISLRNSASDLFITIIDNGIGIENESQRRIFDLFYRASERSGGAGIGLYVVREVLTKMGGNIMVDSTPGIGSKFFIRIPNAEL